MKIKRLLSQFTAWNIQHIPREANQVSHEEAQKVLEGRQMVAKIEDPLYRGRQHLATVVDFLLTGQLPKKISKNQKVYFLRKANAEYSRV